MTTSLKSLQELATISGDGAAPPSNGQRNAVEGTCPIGPLFGEVYWIKNKAMHFGDCQNGGMHPGVVIKVGTTTATVCPMTSKTKRRQGFVYYPEFAMRLSKPGTVLTVKSLWRQVPISELVQRVGLMGPEWQEKLMAEVSARGGSSRGAQPRTDQIGRTGMSENGSTPSAEHPDAGDAVDRLLQMIFNE